MMRLFGVDLFKMRLARTSGYMVLVALGILVASTGCTSTPASQTANVPSAPAPANVQVSGVLQQPASAGTVAVAPQLSLTFNDHVWQPSATDIGWQAADTPTPKIDAAAVRTYIEHAAADINQPPVDADLQLNGTQVITHAAQVGREVLLDDTVQAVQAALTESSPQTVALQVHDVAPRLSTAAVADAQQRIASMLQAPLTLTIGKKQYTWSVDDLAAMLTVNRTPKDGTTDELTIALDPAKAATLLTPIANETEVPVVQPRVDWNGGNLTIARAGTPGARLDATAALKLINDAFSTARRDVTLPLASVAPITAADLGSLGIKDLVGTGKSDFSGSAAYRIHNIGVGMGLLDGILIAPGQEFSFNNAVGNIDASEGFVQGYAIISNRTQLEFGGGICQDSTTVFRAAFWAGLPITERKEHSFYISWYDKYGLGPEGNGPGLDATIYTGVQDLKFANDTGHWLLMQASAAQATATVTLYGTDPGRSVSITHETTRRVPAPKTPQYTYDPKMAAGALKQTDTARGGMTIDVYRTITDHGVQHDPELFRTTFKAWPNIFTYGPGGNPQAKPVATAVPTADLDVVPTAEPAVPTATDEQPPVPGAVEGAPTVAPEQPTDAPPAPEQPQPTPAPEQPQPTDAPPAPEQPAPEQPQPTPAPEQPAPEQPQPTPAA